MIATLAHRARVRCQRIAAGGNATSNSTSNSASDAGFSLLEVIVSFVIFAVVAGSATAAIVSALRASHSSQQRVDAAQVALQFVSDAQRNPGSMQPESSKTFPTVGVQNEQFSVTRSIVFSNSGTTTCISGMYFTVHVTVNQAQTGKFLARSDTVVTC